MLRVAAQFGQDVLLARVCTSVEDDLRTRYVASAMCYRLVQERLDAGEAAIQATMEVERISNAILLVLRSIVPSILQFMVMLGYMVYVSPLLTACILLTAPLMAFVYASLERRLDQSIRTTQKLFAHYAAHAADSFRNRLLLQLYLAQTFAESKLQAIAMNVMQAKIRMHTLRASIIPAVSICYMITVLTMLYVSALCISKGLLYPKELVSFLASVAFLIEPVQGIASGLGNIKEGEESARRVFRVIEKSPQMGFTKPMIHLRQAVAYEIALSNVWFRYSADSDYVLRDVSMTARPGERIAIVGGSGAGKSTLVSLLSRMYDPQKGSIYLDGIDLRDLPHEEIRQRICVVPQDAPMLNWSVRENVSFGLPMEQEKVEQCCRLANAHEFIVNNLPNAYDTEVGEGGSNLSGGQRQRIAIARALYRDPGVLILDEACSALDAENENLVQNALRELFESSNNPRTTIFIAHRLASVRYADRIVVMENGSIVEDGTHEELVDMKNSRYGTLLAMQQGDL
jgi:ABC-type multidrug transport system fused ATPase/permease subunit